MTDWGVHLLDVVHYAFNEQMPLAVTALGSKFYVDDNVDTPDSMMATYHFPTFVGSYESRTCNPLPYWGQNYGTSFHGTKATLVVNRGGYWLYPNEKGKDPLVVDDPDLRSMNHQHWENFLECIKTRKPPIAEIETTVRSTFTCLLANIALRAKCRVDWDDQKKTVLQPEAVPYTKAHYRAPWKLEV
jgi:predicted dehydrogenase